MAIIIRRPLAIGNDNAWALAAGATKMAAIDSHDPVTHDDDTSYLNTSGVSVRQSFTMMTMPGVAVLNSFTMAGRAKAAGDSGAANDTVYLYTRNATVVGGNFAPAPFNAGLGAAAYATCALTTPLRPGGGAWLASDMTDPAVQIGCQAGSGIEYEGDMRMTTIWAVVDGILIGGGFLFFLLSLGPFVALTLEEMPRLARALRMRDGHIIQPDEYVTAWRELTAHRYPRYFFLGA